MNTSYPWRFVPHTQITSASLGQLQIDEYRVDHQRQGIWIKFPSRTAVMLGLLGIEMPENYIQ